MVLTLLIEISVAPIARLFTDAEAGLYSATYQAPASATLNDGTATAAVQITNTGTLTWNAPGAGDTFALGYHWLDPSSGDIVADGTTVTRIGTVEPGQTTTVDAVIQGAGFGRRLPDRLGRGLRHVRLVLGPWRADGNDFGPGGHTRRRRFAGELRLD